MYTPEKHAGPQEKRTTARLSATDGTRTQRTQHIMVCSPSGTLAPNSSPSEALHVGRTPSLASSQLIWDA